MLTGNVGKAGAGISLLRGKSNAQGAYDMGCAPEGSGMTVPAMIQAAAAGKLAVLYVMGENLASAGANVAEALDKVKFLIVQDMFMTETAQKAHVILPSAAFAERDGTVTNSERRVQRVRKAVEPAGKANADCQIICELAKAMGQEKDFAFATAEQVFAEIVKHVPAYAGISYAQLERPEGIQWPAAGGVFGTAILYSDKFATKDGKGAFAAVEGKAEAAGGEYPFVVQAQWPLGTLSVNTPSVLREWPAPVIKINKTDAKKLGITTGQKVKVTCKTGSIDIAASVTADIREGVVAFPVSFATGPVKIEKTKEA
jgi:formate dehydrogenase major subunit